jgi:hypothetical protein
VAAILFFMSIPASALSYNDPTSETSERLHDAAWDTGFPRRSDQPSTHMSIPDRLDQMAPGPVLGAFLSSLDVNALSGYDRVVVLRAHQRMVSHYQAKLSQDMVSIRDAFREAGDDLESAAMVAASEIRCALHLTRRSADVELTFALDLSQRLPQVFRMLAEGVIDHRRARAIDAGTCHLTAAAAQNVVERIAEAAPMMTTGQLNARIRKLCIESNPDEAKDRYERAVTDRRLVAEPSVDGTANILGLDLPPDRVAAVTRKINAIAKSLRGRGEARSMDQLRADVFLDLLNGKEHRANGRGVVHVTADLDTLAGLTDHPGELNGFAPVISDIARQVVDDQSDAEWRYLITDTETGEHLHSGVTRPRPTASQRRHVESRDRTCSFPGCRMPSPDCDIDHTIAYAQGGVTCPCNNAPGCRHDHILKDHGWSYVRLANGRYEWTSPLGHTYTTWKSPP